MTVYQGSFKKASQVSYALGCTTRKKQFENLDETLKIAKDADIVVLVLGGNSTRLYQNAFENNGALRIQDENEMNCGENIDLASLELEGYQNQLLKEKSNTSLPLLGAFRTFIPFLKESSSLFMMVNFYKNV